MELINSVFAVTVSGGSIEDNLGGGWPYTDLGNLVRVLLQTAMLGAGLLSLALLLLGGFTYITSQGDKMAVDKAQKMITYAIIGLAIIVGSYAIARVIETIFGVAIVSGIIWPSPTS